MPRAERPQLSVPLAERLQLAVPRAEWPLDEQQKQKPVEVVKGAYLRQLNDHYESYFWNLTSLEPNHRFLSNLLRK